jgi:site-specific DNA-methyltransferase (adenine-specific)
MNTILHGNCIDVMCDMDANSMDLVLTDPPYGIAFMGKDWDQALPPKAAFREMYRVLKPGALAFVMSSPRQDVLWRMLQMLEETGFVLKQSFISWIYKSGFPKAYDVGKGIDKKLGKTRKVIGTKKITSHVERGDSNIQVQSYHGTDSVFTSKATRFIEEPASELSKQWEGWKSITGLKPALECVLMVHKPFSEQTIVDNVLTHGTGAINVEACRIPFNGEQQPTGSHSLHSWRATEGRRMTENDLAYQKCITSNKGRFPANLLVSDKALDTGKITKSNTRQPTGHQNIYDTSKGWNPNQVKDTTMRGMNDVGDQSRYFDLDAWSRHHGFLDVPKASKTERNFGLDNFQEQKKYSDYGLKTRMENGSVTNPRTNTQALHTKNVHPTVKPIQLGCYLVELGCPPDGVVLDPFCGSGSFCISAHHVGRTYIGIEINAEYVQIAKVRLAAYPQHLTTFF